jgi:hypothetical protein
VKQKFAAKAPEAEVRFDAKTEAQATESDKLDPIEEALKTL